MIKGVAKPGEIAHLGLSNRLLARLGALLKKKLSVTVAVLEAAKPGSPLETLLLRPEVLHEAVALTLEKLNALAVETRVDAPLSIADDDDGQPVLCLEDELASDDAWSGSSALTVTERQHAAMPAPLEDTSSRTGPASGAGAGSGSGEGLFGESHLTRVRLKLATSASAAERIEALRVLVVSPLIPTEKAEAILQALSDADETVRAEAAFLLPGLGVSPDVASALSDLNMGDPARRIAAADKLAKIAGRHGQELADGAVIVGAIAVLKSDPKQAMKIRLIELLAGRAETAGRNAERLSDLARVIVGLIAAANKLGPSSRELDELSGVSHRLVRELAKAHAQSLRAILMVERERAADAAVEAFLLGSLFDLIPPNDADEERLLDWSAAFLSRDIEEGRGSRAIGAQMSRRGGAALGRLCSVFPGATPGAQKHLLILLDEMCRKPGALPEDFARAAEVVLLAMDSGSKALRMAAMECRLVCDMRVPPETRRQLAEAFLDSTRDFSFSFDIDKAESAVERMGAPAVEPLLARIGKDRAPNERARAVRLLGELALIAKPETVTQSSRPHESESNAGGNPRAPDAGGTGFSVLQKVLTDALRRLEAASLESNFPDRGEVFCALGKIISSPAASIEANAIVARTLLDAAGSGDAKLASRALEGASYLAASRRAKPEWIAETVKLLKAALDAPEPEHLEKKSQDALGDTVFEIEGGDRYAVELPIALNGLERVALAPNCPASTTREIGALLLERWKDICHARRVWGPGNSQALIEAMSATALSENCGAELRLEIVKGLLARLTQTPVMHAISEILAADDTRPSSGVALSVGFAILARHDVEGRMAESDRADILIALARIAGRKLLAAPAAENEQTPAAFRRSVVTELIKGVKDNVPGASKALKDLSVNEALPQELRAEIERRTRARGELMRR